MYYGDDIDVYWLFFSDWLEVYWVLYKYWNYICLYLIYISNE